MNLQKIRVSGWVLGINRLRKEVTTNMKILRPKNFRQCSWSVEVKDCIWRVKKIYKLTFIELIIPERSWPHPKIPSSTHSIYRYHLSQFLNLGYQEKREAKNRVPVRKAVLSNCLNFLSIYTYILLIQILHCKNGQRSACVMH